MSLEKLNSWHLYKSLGLEQSLLKYCLLPKLWLVLFWVFFFRVMVVVFESGFLFKTTRFNIAVAGDYTSSSWKSVCALHPGEKFLCKNVMYDK